MSRQDEARKKAKKKRNKELASHFREVAKKEGFFRALARALGFIKRRTGKKRGRFLPPRAELQRQRLADITGWPKISLCVPVYNPTPHHFDELLKSVTAQSYPNWEMCIANASDERQVIRDLVSKYSDSRIIVEDIENGGIATNTNTAARMASGHYIAFADHDDILSPNALFEMAKAVFTTNAEFIYSDEALFDADYLSPTAAHFKPDYSPQYLLNVNYIGHMVAVRRELFNRVGGLNSEYDGSQDHDFNLRALEETGTPHHIQRVLYYWRVHAESTSGGVEAKPYVAEAAKSAIAAHLERIGVKGTVVEGMFPSTYKVNYGLTGMPLVSIIIPNNEHVIDLDRCIRSIYAKNQHKQFEVIVVENNSRKVDTFNYYAKLTHTYPNCRVAVYEDTEFNFSKICNFGRENAKGSYLLFLNNDTEVITYSWLSEMLGLCQQDEIGIVGALLYYPDDTVQHAGVVTGLGGYAGHSHKYATRGHSGYMFRQACVQELSAVTGACLMIKSGLFDQLGGFDPAFTVAFNDVDLCLRARARGKSVVFTPYAELYHHESKSRGSDEEGPAAQRFAKEQALLKSRYGDALLHDPYYNQNLTLDREDFTESDELPEF